MLLLAGDRPSGSSEGKQPLPKAPGQKQKCVVTHKLARGLRELWDLTMNISLQSGAGRDPATTIIEGPISSTSVSLSPSEVTLPCRPPAPPQRLKQTKPF